ncbi:MAG TPA: hypothetical protein VK524_25385 [Polyangiaceae bacterium]|nr:hypothetical protein [Polyangiaceae bacterium]
MPLRLGDLKRLLERYGFVIEPGTKHWKVRAPDGRMYTIPAHNGLRTEMSRVYLRGLCRNLDIDESKLDD